MTVDMFTIIVAFFIWTIFAILARLLNFEKYGIEIYPFLILMKSKEKVRKRLYKFVEKHPRLIELYSKLATKIMLGLIFISYAFLAINGILLLAYKFGTSEFILGKFEIIVPTRFSIAQTIFIAVAIFIAIFPHEICHAIVGLKNDMRIEEIAFFSILGIFSGGYVEFDKSEFTIVEQKTFVSELREEEGNRSKAKTFTEKLKKIKEVSAAGLGINLIILLLFIGLLLIMPVITNTLYVSNGVYVVDVMSKSVAEEYGIKPGMIIYAINGTQIHNVSEFIELVDQYRGNVLVFSTNKGNITIVVPPSGKIGVIVTTYYKPRYKFLPNYYDMVYFVYIMFSIQLAVIILNATPLFISDGSQFLRAFILEKTKSFEKAELINFILNMLGISLFILNLILSFI